MHVGGVVVSQDSGLIGTSDADVVLHALADAMLGAAALGDLGSHFPSNDERWQGVDSAELLARVVEMVAGAGFAVANADVTVIAESIRIAPHRDEMRRRIADVLRVSVGRVSVKATTTDGMGFLGRDEGVAATVVVALEPGAPSQLEGRPDR